MEAVVVISSALSGEAHLVNYSFDPITRRWGAPTTIIADGSIISGVTNTPSAIQADFGGKGNYEMVVPQDGVVVHYWRDNDAPERPWHRNGELPPVATGEAGRATAAAEFAATSASLFSSTMRSDGWIGDLQALVRFESLVGGDDFLCTYTFTARRRSWIGPEVVDVNGQAIQGTRPW
jgi:hypothetical protein